MERLQINESIFLQMPKFQVEHIRKKGNLLYKKSRNSKQILDVLDSHKENPIINDSLVFANAYLYDGDEFFGFVMNHYQDLISLTTLINSPSFDFNAYIKKLITILEELEDLELCYYDITKNNIKSKGTEPFLLDSDGMILNPSIFYKKRQRQKLIEFILSIKFQEGSSENFLKEFLRKIKLEDYFTKDFICYMREIFDISSHNIMFPTFFLNELDDPEKNAEIKKLLI